MKIAVVRKSDEIKSRTGSNPVAPTIYNPFSWRKKMTIAKLVGLTLKEVTGLENGSEEVVFESCDGKKFKMEHYQD